MSHRITRRRVTVVLIVLGAVTIAAPAAWANLTQVGVKTQPNPIREIAPAASAGYFAWAQTSAAHPNIPNVYEQVMSSGSPTGTATKVNVTGSYGFAGGISATRLAYQQVVGSQSDIRFYNLALHQHSNPPVGINTTGWEYSPKITDTWLFFGRDRNGKSSALLYNFSTKSIRVLLTVALNSKGTAFVKPGQVNGNYATFYACSTGTSCSTYFYDIGARILTKIPRPAGTVDYDAAVSATGTLYWARSGTSCGSSVRIMELPLGGSQTTLQTFNAGTDLADLTTYNDGSNNQVFYTRITCVNSGQDIYRIAAP
jgi:hypothetical protein